MVLKRIWLPIWLVFGPSALAQASCPRLILDILSGGDPGEYSEIRKFQTDTTPDLSPGGGIVFQQTPLRTHHEVSYLGSWEEERPILMPGTAEMVNLGHPHQTAFSGDGNRAFFFATESEEKDLVVFDFNAPSFRTLISDFGSSKERPECRANWVGLNYEGNRAVVLTNCGELRIFDTGSPSADSRQAPLVFAKKFNCKLSGMRTVGDRFLFFTDTSLVVGRAPSSGANPELLESVKLPEIEGSGWEMVGVGAEGETAVISRSHWGGKFNFIWKAGRQFEPIPVPFLIWEARFSSRYVLLVQSVPNRSGVVKAVVWDGISNHVEDRIQFSFGQDEDGMTYAFVESANIPGVADAWMVAVGVTDNSRNCPISVYCFTAQGKVRLVGSFDGPPGIRKLKITKDGLGLVVTYLNHSAPENAHLPWTTIYQLSRTP